MTTGGGGRPEAEPVTGASDEREPRTPIQLTGTPEPAMAIATRRIRQGLGSSPMRSSSRLRSWRS
jgi:hypothetical protein